MLLPLPALFICSFLILADVASGLEYCEDEQFEVACEPSHVILVQSALYGRMQPGRCIYGRYATDVNCQNDVIELVSGWCSGRNTCVFPVSKLITDVENNNCPTDLRSYLDVSYKCQKVIALKPCTTGSGPQLFLNSPNSTEVVSSVQAAQQNCIGKNWTWNVHAFPGQRIHFKIETIVPSRSASLAQCPIYARMMLVQLQTEHTLYKCSSGDFVEFISTSNVQQFSLANPEPFLLYYTAVGCRSDAAPDGGWSKPEDNALIVGCHSIKTEWRLTCQNSYWSPAMPNCSTYAAITAEDNSDTNSVYLMIALVVAIAFVVAVLTVVAGVVVLKRRQQRAMVRTPSRQNSIQYSLHDPHYNPYFATWQLRLHQNSGLDPGYQQIGDLNQQCCSCQTLRRNRPVEGIYDIPDALRQDIMQMNTNGDAVPVHYFTLDPEIIAAQRRQQLKDQQPLPNIPLHSAGDDTNQIPVPNKSERRHSLQ